MLCLTVLVNFVVFETDESRLLMSSFLVAEMDWRLDGANAESFRCSVASAGIMDDGDPVAVTADR
jgi:hypothetical protein